MYNSSQTFRDNIKNPAIPQDFLLVFSDLYFSAKEGDFQEGGAKIEETFQTDENLDYGECPASTLDFAVMNLNGALGGYPFGECKAFVGVKTSETTYTSSAKAYMSINSVIYTIQSGGLYKGSTLLQSGDFNAIFALDGYLHVIGEGASYRVQISNDNISAYAPTLYMYEKSKVVPSMYFDGTNSTSWADGVATTYEYVPLGVFNVEQPQSTLADVITVNDAYDRMVRFDVDSKEFAETVTYPITLGDLLSAMCSYVGVTLATTTFTNSAYSVTESPFPQSATTLRTMLGWIAEKAYKVACMDRDGQLVLKWLSSSTKETLTPNDIARDNYYLAEFETEPVSGVMLKANSGASIIFGAKTNIYAIYGNPFITTISESELTSRYKSIKTYTPISCTIIDPDPSVDVGDLVSIQPSIEGYAVYTDQYGAIYIDLNDNALITASTAYIEPLLHRVLSFNGAVSAVYSAEGTKLRATPDASDYNQYAAVEQAAAEAVHSMTQEDVFNALTNNGEVQGLYLYNNKIYINAEYIKAGVLSGIAINNGNGTFTVDENGNVVANSLTSNSAAISGGSIGGINISGNQIASSNNVFKVTSAGAVTANSFSSSSATITGGTININASSGTEGIKLRQTGNQNNYAALTPRYVRVQYGSNYATYSATGVTLGYSGTQRVYLDYENGITFYNANGSVHSHYGPGSAPSVNSIGGNASLMGGNPNSGEETI